MPSLSLLVSSYNQLELLQVALASVTEQTQLFDEIIVVDDASTDGTPEFLRDWVKEDDNRRVMYRAENQGPSAVRNVGLEQVTSDYVVVMDGDDWLELEAVAQIHDVLDHEQPDIVVFQAYFYLQAEDRYMDGLYGNKLYTDDVFHQGVMKTAAEKVAYFRVIPPLWNKVHRMGFLREHAITSHFKIYEDIFWLHQCGVFAKEIRGVGKPMVTYRIHDKSVLRQKGEVHFAVFEVIDACEQFMITTSQATGLRQASHRYQFDIIANIALNTERIPEPLKPVFAAQILERSYLLDFEMEDFEVGFLEQLRAMAKTADTH